MGYRIAIDVGGTFTDIIVLDSDTCEIVVEKKVLSTPRKPEVGVLRGISSLAKPVRETCELVLHATTIATNALLGQIGLEPPKTALITTRGFRDVLEIGRQNRPSLYDLFFTKPRPLVPRRLRFEVDERIDARGRVLRKLNISELKRIAELLKRMSVSAVAVCFLHSYANPIHEQEAKRVLSQHLRREFICTSHEVCPEPREFERMSTTVINAMLMPIVSRYLTALERGLREAGVRSKLLVMQSHGGLASCERVANLPVSLIESGPAAGVMAAAWLAELLGIERVISFDMGGTTAKASTVVDGKPAIVTEYEVGAELHHGRIVKGSGYPVKFPFVDLAEVSAGGGTVIWVDEAGGLRVGPRGAGADPGPACYGRGGPPTITDAHLVLGRLNELLLGGEMKIHKELALKALKKLADSLNLDVIDIALGALKLVDLAMSRAIRLVTIERGLDPREFTLVAFGGAGPMHACELAEELGIRRVVVPRAPGLFSAVGLLVSDVKVVVSESARVLVDEADPEELEERYRRLERRALNILRREEVKGDVCLRRLADMRYAMQGYELLVEVPRPVPSDMRTLSELFHLKHETTYGYSMRDEPVEIVVLRVEATVRARGLRPRRIKSRLHRPAPVERRSVFFGDQEETCPVFRREQLAPGVVVPGPAIIEEYSATTVVPAGWEVRVDAFGNLVIERC